MPALTQHRIRCATLSRFNTRHSFHDPFDFDDRPHIERLMKPALANVQGDIAADMDERMWAQVKLADAGNLSRESLNK